MTRINLVSPAQLTSIHLMAEYRELPRVFTRVKWRITRGQKLTDISERIQTNYTLNTGHETFFNDKLAWLYERYIQLYNELLKRGYRLDIDKHCNIKREAYALVGTEWWGNYSPTPEEIYLNMARLVRRSKLSKVLAEASASN